MNELILAGLGHGIVIQLCLWVSRLPALQLMTQMWLITWAMLALLPTTNSVLQLCEIWLFPTWLLCHCPWTQTFLSVLSVRLISFLYPYLSHPAIPGVTSRSFFTSSPLSLIPGKGLTAVTQETETWFSWHNLLWVTVGIWMSAGEAKVKLLMKKPQERRLYHPVCIWGAVVHPGVLKNWLESSHTALGLVIRPRRNNQLDFEAFSLTETCTFLCCSESQRKPRSQCWAPHKAPEDVNLWYQSLNYSGWISWNLYSLT